MRYAALSIFVLICNQALAAEGAPSAEASPSKVYYRCESRGLNFDDASLMKEVKPGQFSLTVPVSAGAAQDNCVVSVMEDEGSGAELCFMDLFPSLSKNEAALVGKSYSLGANQRLTTFKVDYSTGGTQRVTFDAKNRSFRVEKPETAIVTAMK